MSYKNGGLVWIHHNDILELSANILKESKINTINQ